MKFSTIRTIGLVSLVMALAIGIGSFVWVQAHRLPPSPVENVRSVPETALFVPKQAPAMASLLVNAKHLQRSALNALPTDQQRQVRSGLSQLNRQIKNQLGLDIDADVLPWAGDELTVALTTWDVDRDPSTGVTPGFLLAAAVWDTQQAASSLEKLWQRQSRSSELIEETYSGVKLVFPDAFTTEEWVETNKPLFATAQVGSHYVLFANSPNVLRNAVNTLQAADLSLGNSPRYLATLNRLPEERVGLLWLDVPALQTWLSLHGTVPAPPLFQRLKAAPRSMVTDKDQMHLPPVEILAANLAIAPSGLIANTVLTPLPGTTFTPYTPHPLETLESLRFAPVDSSLVIAGANLAATWDTLTRWRDQGNTLAKRVTQSLAQRQEEWAIDVTQDVLPWAEDGFALARVAVGNGSESRSDARSEAGDAVGTDWVFATHASEASQQEIQRLDAIAQQQGLSVGPLPIRDQSTVIWTRLNAVLNPDTPTTPVTLETQVNGIHATVEEWEVLATSVDAIGKTLITPENSLAASPQFQQAIAALKAENDGYLYIDWDLAQSVLKEEFPVIAPLLSVGEPVLGAVRSLVISRYGSQLDAQELGVALLFPENDEMGDRS